MRALLLGGYGVSSPSSEWLVLLPVLGSLFSEGHVQGSVFPAPSPTLSLRSLLLLLCPSRHLPSDDHQLLLWV